MTTRQLSGFRNFKSLKSRCCWFNRFRSLTGEGIVNSPDLGYLLNAYMAPAPNESLTTTTETP
jgi:hypothetical protein